MSKEYVKAIKLPSRNNSIFKHVITPSEVPPAHQIDSDKFSTIEKIHHMNELIKAVDFKIEYLGKRGLEVYTTNFKSKGVMAPEKIEHYCQDGLEDQEVFPRINICLKKERDGSFVVLG